ncbi:MAG: hypothetical protein LBD24_05445 [Spirochaetaceae bacterium]|jgi:hypothetical protein|nr:hypothetical protein [Spirochaetaceae bacterium]
MSVVETGIIAVATAVSATFLALRMVKIHRRSRRLFHKRPATRSESGGDCCCGAHGTKQLRKKRPDTRSEGHGDCCGGV